MIPAYSSLFTLVPAGLKLAVVQLVLGQDAGFVLLVLYAN